MKQLILKRRIQAEAWRFTGQVARAGKRPELLPVLLRIDERGETDARDIAEHLFFEARSRRVVAERLLQIATAYQLLESDKSGYRLTDTGRKALETKEVFVPEHGDWTLWASDDPLLASPVLHIEAWSEPSAMDEVWGNDKDKAKERRFQSLPAWLTQCSKQEIKPCAAGGEARRIDEFSEEGERIETEVEADLVWDVVGGRLRASGSVAGRRFDTDLVAPDIDVEAVWRQLLEAEGLWSRWDTSRRKLLVEFDGTSEVERESMMRRQHFARPSIGGCGAFEPLDVPGVALAASAESDARQWANWRLDARLRDYATAARFEAWQTEAVAPFPEFDISLPDRAAVAEEAWRSREPGNRPPPQLWHLIAAEDWCL